MDRDKITFVKTAGHGSPSVYSQGITANLSVKTKDISEVLTMGESASLIGHLIRNRNQTFHFPMQHFGKFANFASKSIVTVHDLCQTSYFPFGKPSIRDALMSRLDIAGIKKASHVICVSNYSKHEVIRYMGIESDRISVVYDGIDHDLFKPSDLQGKEEYILFVGSEQPRKNLKTLLEAFAIIKKDERFKGLRLVKVGGPEKESYRKETLASISRLGLEKCVDLVGFVSSQRLAEYYCGAKCLVLPSYFEGFGLVPVEAMACGCPVVTSDVCSLPEVITDAGLMNRPDDAEGFAQSVKRILTEDALREELVRKGVERAKFFSWENAAKQVGEIYDRI
jgi:glycosyltransferase involved in cell wall biosynthesis